MSGAVKSVSWNDLRGRVGRDEPRHRALSEVARLSALAPFGIRNYRFQWPADLLTSWAFEMETLILGWYVLAETGSVLLLTLIASLNYTGTLIAPIVRGDRRPHRSPRPAGDDASDLCGARRHADDAGADRPSEPVLCLHHRGDHGSRSTVGSRRARRAGCHHHAAGSIDWRDQPVANHDGHGADRRRAERRRAVGLARDRAGLCGDLQPLHCWHAADPVRRGAVDAASGRCNG